ncbi:MAG: DUF4340 domain-containing protein [Gammaproteobacteria bacterium]|nr:DUF4340 domain-containing protein [Gammaproteobacteria bacterium]
MNRRELSTLAALTGIVLLLTIVMYNVRHQSGDQEYMGTLWLGDLDINSISRIDLTGPGNMPLVALERRPEGWGVVQRQYYPANVGAIRSFLLDLSEAKLLERKTSDPAQHAQLGLGSIDRLDALGQLVTLHFADGTRAVRIGTSPEGRNATYVRDADDDQGWLVDRDFTIPEEPRRWLDPDLLDIGMERVFRMEVVHPDGERIEGQRAEEAGDVRFTVLNLPEGAMLKNEYALNRMASAIASLSLEDVMPASQAQVYLEDAIRARYELYQGYSLEAYLFSVDVERYARFVVHLGENMSDEDRAQAELLARHLEDWAFRIPSFAYSSMALRWSDILEGDRDPE